MQKRNYFAVLTMIGSMVSAAPLTDADDIVARANLAAYYAGTDGRAEVRMIISDAKGRQQRRQFTVLRRDLEDGGEQQFLVSFSQPSDVRGTAFLVDKHTDRDDDRWFYLPGLDLVKRIAASDKRSSFVGAHFYYEDVSGRRPTDDSHRLINTTDAYYVVRHTPIKPSLVEFAHYTTWIDRKTYLPMKIEYTNASGKIYRIISVQSVEVIDGHATVTGSRVEDLQSGGQTDMQFRHIQYDIDIPASLFSERSLRNAPRQWLKPRPR